MIHATHALGLRPGLILTLQIATDDHHRRGVHCLILPLTDQIDNRACGNTRRNEYDGKSDEMDLDHLLFAVAN